MTQINNDQIFDQVQTLLVELFELDANDIHLDSHLYQDLDLDSIDAVDLVVRLQNFTGKKIQPDEFKNVRTVNDVVIAVADLLKAK
ncbi:acyl carrier protein [Photobacterium phosphoreum]|jgi:acyl carrier protein|uniref:Acyl carrier protein n=1 Tax=Photobacterium phosphoreum TaxID=659 RepID=A0A2T3PT95_PHOPO|nr:acyl carrier protein [Photobacterium phosphoreum]KJF87379.1 acyl carrier protein [Photobacterium phosphoreum]MCD9462216.1 acyl carrier protein [Photobacterium phosphoreum]MCD9469203.1 acyl carrier protein [Photobacterium phosphoreum]MCD9474163.1 acyl carrier protein [Photobacterium phosphoreum]MCD9477709.1 acyl carrier protein [Photobacterium phosphoreum]